MDIRFQSHLHAAVGVFVITAIGAPSAAGEVIARGASFETTVAVKLRDAPPEQALGIFVERPGKQIEELQPGAKVRVEAVQKAWGS
jgi:hypothetical protein